MDYYLGHTTALRYLRKLRFLDPNKRCRSAPKARMVPNAEELRRKTNLEGPINVIVADAASRSRANQIESRIWHGPTGGYSFFKAKESILVSCPEACLTQLAADFNVIHLMKIGFELCGTYRLDPSSEVGFRKAKPLCSSASFRRFVSKMPPSDGLKNARRAASFIKDGSASPMETCLALMLGLPTSLGGYGLGMPEMNTAISAPAGTRTLMSYHQYHCDLYWPDEQVAVEYNSRQFHLNEQAVARDSSRMNDLAAYGITALSVTRQQIANPREMDSVAQLVAKAMKRRLRYSRKGYGQLKQQLRRELFAKDSSALGRSV